MWHVVIHVLNVLLGPTKSDLSPNALEKHQEGHTYMAPKRWAATRVIERRASLNAKTQIETLCCQQQHEQRWNLWTLGGCQCGTCGLCLSACLHHGKQSSAQKWKKGTGRSLSRWNIENVFAVVTRRLQAATVPSYYCGYPNLQTTEISCKNIGQTCAWRTLHDVSLCGWGKLCCLGPFFSSLDGDSMSGAWKLVIWSSVTLGLLMLILLLCGLDFKQRKSELFCRSKHPAVEVMQLLWCRFESFNISMTLDICVCWLLGLWSVPKPSY